MSYIQHGWPEEVQSVFEIAPTTSKEMSMHLEQFGKKIGQHSRTTRCSFYYYHYTDGSKNDYGYGSGVYEISPKLKFVERSMRGI